MAGRGVGGPANEELMGRLADYEHKARADAETIAQQEVVINNLR